MRIDDTMKDLIMTTLTDDEIWDAIGAKFTKALKRNAYLTSVACLEFCTVQDIYGGSPEKSGFYFIFDGTRTKVTFFMNNNLEVVRKPRNVEVRHEYLIHLDEGFWDDVVEAHK